MSYLADDAAMRTHFDGQGGMITRDEVPVQEREADDSYDRLVQAIRVRSFDALLELAREGLAARDVQNAEHDARAGSGPEFLTAAEVRLRQDDSDYHFGSRWADYVRRKAGSATSAFAPNRIAAAKVLGELSDRAARIATDQLVVKDDSVKFDSADLAYSRLEGSAI